MAETKTGLKRSLSLPLITFYGLGNILGAGIYVLVGKVAADAGYYAPLAFLLASLIAAVSAFSYAELSARYPYSAGEAVYLYEGFGIQKLSLVVGLMISCAGIVSAAAIAHGFAGYLRVFVDIPAPLIITLLLVLLGGLAIWGISQSVMVVSLLTLLEIAGLLLIAWLGVGHFSDFPALFGESMPASGSFSFVGLMSGAFLAFYAYIGFEDMVNVAEEVKDPHITMPLAILLCVVISCGLYAAVAVTSLMILTPAELAASSAPLADVYVRATGNSPIIISVIGMFAVVNGALIQMIMSSRLFYGMAVRGWLPGFLGRVHAPTRIPMNSTLLVLVLIFAAAMMLPLVTLAELTSYLVLMVFALVNLSLLKIKERVPHPEDIKVFPLWIPKLGFSTAMLLLLFELISSIF